MGELVLGLSSVCPLSDFVSWVRPRLRSNEKSCEILCYVLSYSDPCRDEP